MYPSWRFQFSWRKEYRLVVGDIYYTEIENLDKLWRGFFSQRHPQACEDQQQTINTKSL